MSTKKLFDEDSEEEVAAIKTENEYAKKYDAWREKEELHKLEQKYGSKPLNTDASSSSDSEDESDEPVEVSEEVEKQFLKTLALLKTKDPRIYDPNYKFFDEHVEKEKEKEPVAKKLTFGDSDDSDDDDPNIFSIEKKAEIDHSDDDKDSREKSAKEDKLKDYLTGKVDHVDQELENDLAPLRSLWSDPKINEGEAFLRDYILNKRYLEDGEAGEAGDRIRDDAALEEDEQQVEEQGKFERAYNFRFEEPDEEYLKRFPRTMNYIRPKDDRRSRKRAEIRARKEEEKRQKMEEIARMKALKLKEIQEKIAKIKEVTGNQDLAFKEEDIEGDFDPEEHDRRMKALFDEQYYGEADDQKPVFPDLDEELEIENWEKYEEHQDISQNQNDDEDGPHCEDDNFNMDADYDPKQAKMNLLEELKRNMGKKRRNRKRKSKLAQLLAEDKPKFVPSAEQQYAQFMEEYYRMDCEDVIAGDLPTRFKYRQVVPNDFGLTVEEILLADDKELTQWVPLKKIVKYRPENVEKGEVKTYAQKAADERLKKKILPSLFKDLPEEPEIVVPPEQINKKRKKKKKKNKEQDETETPIIAEDDTSKLNVEENETEDREGKKHDIEVKRKKNKRKRDVNTEDYDDAAIQISGNDKIEADENTMDKPKKKKKRKNDIITEEDNEDGVRISRNDNITADENTTANTKKKNKKQHEINREEDIENHVENSGMDYIATNIVNNSKKNNKRKRDFNTEENDDHAVEISRNDNVRTDDNTMDKHKKKEKRIQDIKKQDKYEDKEISRYNDSSVDENADRPKKKKRKQDNYYESNSYKQNAVNDLRHSEISDENAKKLNENKMLGKAHKISSKEITTNLSDSKISKHFASNELSSTLEFNSENNKKVNKKSKFKNTFIIDSVVNEGPSRISDEKNNGVNFGAKKKTSNKKQSKNKQQKLKHVNVKMKANFKRRNKMSSANEKSSNPLSDLSDERLKAYGLNPKKYRSFLKYKKF